MQTAILTICRCGWVGIAHSSAAALENWHCHAFDAHGDSHERVGEMAVSNPLNALGLYRVREEAQEQARLARWKGYQREHGALETEPLAAAEGRLRRGALTALAMMLALGGLVWEVVR